MVTNEFGKTSVMSAIAVGLGSIPKLLPDVSGINFLKTDQRLPRSSQVELTTTDGVTRRRTMGRRGRRAVLRELKEAMGAIVDATREQAPPLELPAVTFHDPIRAVIDKSRRRRGFKTESSRYAVLEGALSARTDFKGFFGGGYVKEYEELRRQNEPHYFDFQNAVGGPAKFFTSSRSYFVSLGEDILEEPSQAWI